MARMTRVVFKLYIAGSTPRSQGAVANLRRLGEERLSGNYELIVIDVKENPQVAEAERILATPTLVKESPLPLRRVTGDLSDQEMVWLGLAIPKFNDEEDES
ncbi:MAG TPA: circadian clock KaiB family protein [Longimicrobiaceae bacterium]|nr:circadian clock KaiB family protein [Longimicrobiaceae bacterium]